MQLAEWRRVGAAATIPCRTRDCPGQMTVTGRLATCPVCKTTYERERPTHSHRTVLDLTDANVAAILARLADEPRDFAICGFLLSGFRESEVVGGRGDNDVLLPGVAREDIRLEEEACWVVGKGQSRLIAEQKEPRRILQPVARVFLEAALSRDIDHGPLFPDVYPRMLRDLVKDWARQAGIEDYELVRCHRLRHWFSIKCKERGGLREGPAGLCEWIDLMRHSRKGSGVTLSFYSGQETTFQRKRELALATVAPVLSLLDEESFIGSLPPPLPERIDTVSRVHTKSEAALKTRVIQHKSSLYLDYADTLPSKIPSPSSPIERSSSQAPDPTVEPRRCEWPKGCTEQATVQLAPGWFCQLHSYDPFGAY